MDILVADDDPLVLLSLEQVLKASGYTILPAADGTAAWEILERPDAPSLAILDWAMPGLDGPDICRRVRQRASAAPPYLILLTARVGTDSLVAGLDAGADEYLVKPVDAEEVRARVRAAGRILELQWSLAARLAELTAALESVRHLQLLLPVCARCKRMRSDQEYWQLIVEYMRANPEMDLSLNHCRECLEEEVREEVAGRTDGTVQAAPGPVEPTPAVETSP